MKTKISEDIKSAMKARNQVKLNTLRGLMSEIKKVEIDSKKELADGDVTTLIQKEVKKRRDTIRFAKDAGRDEMVAQNESEIEILQEYLGKQLSEDELRALIKDLVDSGSNAIGQIMGSLNKSYKGQFDGRLASEIAKSLI